MTNKTNPLSQEDFQFLMDALISGKEMSDADIKRYDRLMLRDAKVRDIIVVADTMTEIMANNIVNTLRTSIAQLAEVVQIQDKLLTKLGVTEEDKAEALNTVQEEIAEATKAQLEALQKQQEEAQNSAPKEAVSEDGLKVVEVENTVDLSIDKK